MKNAYFSDIKFTEDLDFSAANLTGGANFFKSQFNVTSFSNCIFGGPAKFGLTRFSGLSSFGEAYS